MPDIRADLSAINKEVRNIESAAKSAAKETRRLQEEMRFNPTSIEAVKAKYDALNKELEENNKLLIQIQQAQRELEALNGTTTDEKQINAINTALDKLNGKLYKVQSTIRYLTEQTSDQKKQTDLLNVATNKWNDRMATLEKTARSASLVIAAFAAVMARLTTQLMEQGAELTSLSTKYGTAVEDIQRWNYALQSATGQSNLFTGALDVLSKGMSEIASGRGIAYEQALNNIGLSYAQISSLSMEEKFETIVKALQNTTDASERAAAAQKLLGDSGMTIAGIFEDENSNLSDYLEKANDLNVITTEQAEALRDMKTNWEAVKLEMQATFADVVVALAPALEVISYFLTEVISPVLSTLADGLRAIGAPGQTILMIVLTLVVFLPKLIGLMKIIFTASTLVKGGLTGVNAAAAALNVTSAKWQLILLGIVTVIMTIISLLGLLTGKADEANESLQKTISDAQNAFGIADAELTSSTEAYTHNESTVNLNVDVYGHGDTAVSDANAVKVATLTIDSIQKQLGELIK